MTGSLHSFLAEMFGGAPKGRRGSEERPARPPTVHRREQVLKLEQHVSPAGRVYLTGKWGRAAILVVAPEKPGEPWAMWAKPTKASAAGASGMDCEQFDARHPKRVSAARAAVRRG